MELVPVPCNGCTACCKRDLILLHPEHGDDPAQFDVEPVRNPLTGAMSHAVKRKADGSCIYLGITGCTIHGRQPVICREFDCRRMYATLLESTTRAERRRAPLGRDVLAAGRKRLHTLGAV